MRPAMGMMLADDVAELADKLRKNSDRGGFRFGEGGWRWRRRLPGRQETANLRYGIFEFFAMDCGLSGELL
jgi:hypothetical protein